MAMVVNGNRKPFERPRPRTPNLDVTSLAKSLAPARKTSWWVWLMVAAFPAIAAAAWIWLRH